MATYYEIPLSPTAQRFYITLAAVQYLMQVAYRVHDVGGWFLDIYTAGGDPLVLGTPLVTGVDLLQPYPDKNFGGGLYVATDGDPFAVPTYDGLGNPSHLYFEVAA